ncbi:ABC transporter permease [Telmatospirillum siberiense]|uniref:ABC transporter permease n=1 Tax=Telmatospirillum siberiense TaxID=382514 RepID=A0A2N3PSV2_9PROT|nr:ABC transporter permease [Telmatospirillum siberiense]PKU23446.1 ABC transporter permease [Telmatospirillum siberiense]
MAICEFIVNWAGGVPATALPYALAALGLIVSERAGVLNLTAEGLLLVGALAGIGASLAIADRPWVALPAAVLAAMAVGLLFAGLVVLLRVNQVIAGLAVVFFCQGLTSLLGTLAEWQNHPISGLGKLIVWPLSELPAGTHALFQQDGLVYALLPIFYGVHRVLFKSMTGLRLRAVGEAPEAADSAGLGVTRYRVLAVVAGSALIGLAGGYLAVGGTKMWFGGMTGGRGWIAVALVIFARWRPWRALFGALLFGCIESMVPRIAAAGISVPQYFILMTPYLVTIAVMVWAGRGKGGADLDEPGALGRPHVREERR